MLWYKGTKKEGCVGNGVTLSVELSITQNCISGHCQVKPSLLVSLTMSTIRCLDMLCQTVLAVVVTVAVLFLSDNCHRNRMNPQKVKSANYAAARINSICLSLFTSRYIQARL